MHASLALALVLALTGTLSSPVAGAHSLGMSWADWLWDLRAQLDQIAQLIAHLREALATSVSGWWQEILPQIAHDLGLADLEPVLSTLEAIMAQLPGDLGNWLQSLVQQLVGQTAVEPEPGTTAQTFRTAVTLDPRLRAAEQVSVARQVNAVSAITLAEVAQQSTDNIATELAQSTAAVKAAEKALGNADTLDDNVAGAQSSRALLQYLGEGLANLMRQDATLGELVSQHLAGLSQQDALATRDQQMVVSLLAQDALAQEQARRGQAVASQEALRLLAEGYSTSLIAVGSSLVDLHDKNQVRRQQLVDALTPAP